MSTEPTRPTAASIERGRLIAESMMDHATAEYRARLAEERSEPTRPPAEAHTGAPNTSGTGSDRGTGAAEAHGPFGRDFDCCATSTTPMDIVARHLHQAIDTAAPRIAEELTPVLLASTAAAIRYIAEHGLPGRSDDFMAGVAFAATLIDHTRADLEDGHA